jgi:hypothetical protein
MAFGRNKKREAETDAELVSYASWVKEIREPDVDNDGIRRLESEIRAKRNEILNALNQRYVHPRNHKITEIRRDVDELKGMVFAWLYVSGKWVNIIPIEEVNEEVNDLAMLWLSVDLIRMIDRAYPKKAPRDI